MSWDFGLCDDIAFLRMFRRGPLPFAYMASLWDDLHKRRELLELEQKDCAKPFNYTSRSERFFS